MTQRSHDIGIRMALGAERRDMLKLATGEGMILTLVGVVTGLVGVLDYSPDIEPTVWRSLD